MECQLRGPGDAGRYATKPVRHASRLMFINPMWDNESQRIGKQRCTPAGYAFHVISDLIGLNAIILLLGIPIYLVYVGIRGRFALSMLWLLVVPFAIAIVGNLLHSYSWHLAEKRQFNYDYEDRIATWIDEDGNEQSYECGSNTSTSDQSSVN